MLRKPSYVTDHNNSEYQHIAHLAEISFCLVLGICFKIKNIFNNIFLNIGTTVCSKMSKMHIMTCLVSWSVVMLHFCLIIHHYFIANWIKTFKSSYCNKKSKIALDLGARHWSCNIKMLINMKYWKSKQNFASVEWHKNIPSLWYSTLGQVSWWFWYFSYDNKGSSQTDASRCSPQLMLRLTAIHKHL